MTSHSLPHCSLSTCGITSCGRREDVVCWCLGVWCWPWLHNYYFESIYKEQNLVCRDFQAYTHRSTHTHEHTDYTKLHLHNLKQAANRDFRQMKTAARNGRHGGSVVLGKRNVFRLHLHESREGFCWRGRERHAMHMDQRQKRCGDQQQRVWCEGSGPWPYQDFHSGHLLSLGFIGLAATGQPPCNSLGVDGPSTAGHELVPSLLFITSVLTSLHNVSSYNSSLHLFSHLFITPVLTALHNISSYNSS